MAEFRALTCLDTLSYFWNAVIFTPQSPTLAICGGWAFLVSVEIRSFTDLQELFLLVLEFQIILRMKSQLLLLN